MTASELLIELKRAGVSLEQVGDRLRIHAPSGALSERLREAIKRRKDELVSLLEHASAAAPRNKLQRLRRGAPFPLSFTQERLWFLEMLEPDSPLYNIPAAVHADKGTRAAILCEAFFEIHRRHEALRATFVVIDDLPAQVTNGSPPETRVIDLEALSSGGRERESVLLARAEAQRPFSLKGGRLGRLTIIRQEPNEHVLVFNLHHAVADGWSLGVLVMELAALAGSYGQGVPPHLDEVQVQYTDYAVMQRRALRGERLNRELAYWREQLSGAPVLLEMPTDRPRPVVQTYRGARVKSTWDPDLVSGIQKLGQQMNTTAFVPLLAVFQCLLSRHSGQKDICVGSPIAGRNSREVEGLIGFFANTIVLRGRLLGNLRFDELLKRTRDMTLEALTHQDLPFEKLVEELQPARSLNYSPLFQVMLAFQNTPMSEGHLRELGFGPIEAASGTSKFDLTLEITENGGAWAIQWEYNSDLFDRSTIQRMANQWEALLHAIIQDPGARLGTLPLLGPAEHQQLSEVWKDPAATYSRGTTVHEMFVAQAERTPDAAAVVFENELVTYAELRRRSEVVAQHLRRLGVGPDALVGVSLQRSADLVVVLLGILEAGAAYLPLDPIYPEERRSFILDDSMARVLVGEDATTSRDGVLALSVAEATTPGRAASRSDPTPSAGEHLSYIIYTSGSTGQPKGSPINHDNVTRLFAATLDWYQFEEQDVWTLFHSYSFDFSVWEMWGALLYGGKLVVVPHLVSRSPDIFHRLTVDEAVTFLNQTPSAFQQFMLADEQAEKSVTGKVKALRAVVFGGEALDLQALAPWYGRHPENHPRLVNMYGITETTVHVTYRPLFAADTTSPSSVIGRSIPDLDVQTVDQEGQWFGLGATGELCVGGDGLGRGYLNKFFLTSSRFVPHPWSEAGQRLYHSGDLARQDSIRGLTYVGRADFQVKIRGFRIELGEIEAVLSSHRALREVIVLARNDVPGETRLVAYVVLNSSHAPSVGELRSHIKDRLPEYMVPAAFVFLQKFPLTQSGKIDRRALPAPEGRPEVADYVAPRNAIEEALVGIWSQVLKVDRVGINDNFFELGGHSLLATQLLSRIRQQLGAELRLRDLFSSPTVAATAQSIASSRGSGAVGKLLRTRRRGTLRASFAQERYCIQAQLDPDSSVNNVPMYFRLVGSANSPALVAVFNDLSRRHEVLRSHYAIEAGHVVQVADRFRGELVARVDLSGLTNSEVVAKRLGTLEAARHFNLGLGPISRHVVLQMNEREIIYLLTMHHIANDGWSSAVFFEEAKSLHERFAKGVPANFGELPIQYADFAAWEQKWLQGRELDAHLSFWKGQLENIATLALPLDNARPPAPSGVGAAETLEVPQSVLDALSQIGRAEGCTRFVTLLAAFEVLLLHHTEQEDLVLGTMGANRSQADFEQLLGCFANPVVLRVRLSRTALFRDLLHAVRSATADAFSYGGLPFDRLVRELNPPRLHGKTPFYQVMFNEQNAGEVAVRQPTALFGMEAERFLGEMANTVRGFDLAVDVFTTPKGLGGRFLYDAEIFQPRTIRRMADHFKLLLSEIAKKPDRAIKDLLAAMPQPRPAVVVAATFTSEPVKQVLRFWLDKVGIACDIKFAPYNQVFQQLLDPSSLLATNDGGANVILVRLIDWASGEEGDGTDDAGDSLARTVDDFCAALSRATQGAKSPFFVCICPTPSSAPGLRGRGEMIDSVEQACASKLAAMDGVYVLDWRDMISLYRVKETHDAYADSVGKIPYTKEVYAALGSYLVRKMWVRENVRYKVIILDCDNTLWRGVCAEDGAEGVQIDAPYAFLQRFMVKQQASGMLLCLCSKNEEGDVVEVFSRRPEMPLRLEHIAAKRINWKSKSENIQSIAAELNLGLDSFIVVDDNAVECAEIRAQCPQVFVIQVPEDSQRIPGLLDHTWAFDHLKTTAEDARRTEMYRQDAEREATRGQVASFAEFLSSLQLKVVFELMKPEQLARVAQLTQRTNQFNFTTVRRSEQEIRQLVDSGAECWTVSVSDRFGDYGLVGVLIFKVSANVLAVDTFLLSCRVLGRQVEHTVLVRLADIAAGHACDTVEFGFIPTKRNAPAQEFVVRVAEPWKRTSSAGATFPVPLAELGRRVISACSAPEALAPTPKSQ